jgi:outer membrane protein assembly factor BamE (lipoprotein component of BamABCDE complex)
MKLDRLIFPFIAIGLLALPACQPGKSLSKANVDQVTAGMAKKQVESILGMPTSVDTKDYESKQKTIYLYRQGQDTVTIVFWEDKVESKNTTLVD